MYADVDVKNAIANGEIPGPQMQLATRAMTPTGMYRPLGVFVGVTDSAGRAVCGWSGGVP